MSTLANDQCFTCAIHLTNCCKGMHNDALYQQGFKLAGYILQAKANKLSSGTVAKPFKVSSGELPLFKLPRRLDSSVGSYCSAKGYMPTQARCNFINSAFMGFH